MKTLEYINESKIFYSSHDKEQDGIQFGVTMAKLWPLLNH